MSSRTLSSARRSASTSSRRSRSPKTVSKITLLRAFDAGDFGLFFRHWSSIIADSRHDVAILHLDFYIRVYFATQRLREPGAKTKPEPFNKAMENFKSYLESAAGVELGKVTELTPYFALPYVKNIEKHPLFKDLKDQKWVSLIRRKLIDFIDVKFGDDGDEQLMEIRNLKTGGVGHGNVGELEERLAQAERKLTSYRNRCTQLQINYHRLILVASELVDALEQTIQGSLVTPEQVEDLRSRMFDTRGSNAASSGRTVSTEDEDRADEAMVVNGAPDDPEPSNTVPSTIRSPSSNTFQHLPPVVDFSFLDWPRIRSRLESSEFPKEIALLFQALRWCVTRCENFESSMAHILVLIQENVLATGNSKEDMLLHGLMTSENAEVQEAFCRFLNTLSCFKPGRNYLLKERSFLPIMVETVQSAHLCPNAACHALVTLQKCSVRRKVQLRLIRLDFMKWLIEYLRTQNATLSNYALEYGTALLMNLSLTTAGRKAAADDPGLILELLCTLMDHEDAYVISPYVNGTLFSILSSANVRHKAKKMGLHSILDKAIQRPKTPSDVRQIPYIIKHLNGELVDKQLPPSDDEYSSSVEDNGNDSEDETVLGNFISQEQLSEVLEPELDEDDTLLPETAHPLAGFELLKSQYSKSELLYTNKDDDGKEAVGENDSTTATTVGPKPILHRPRERPTHVGGKGKMVTQLSKAAREYVKDSKAEDRERANGAQKLIDGQQSVTSASGGHHVRSADPRGRSQRPKGRNSIGALPEVGRRRSVTQPLENDIQIWSRGDQGEDDNKLDSGTGNDVWPFPDRRIDSSHQFVGEKDGPGSVGHSRDVSRVSSSVHHNRRPESRGEKAEPHYSRTQSLQRSNVSRPGSFKKTVQCT